MGNISDKSIESQNTHFKYNNSFPRKSCPIRDNKEKYGTVRQATDDIIIRRMRIACWVTKATDNHSEYVILPAFPQQQWLLKKASVSSYTYISCLIIWIFQTSRSATHCSRACHQRDCVQLRLHIVPDQGVWYNGGNILTEDSQNTGCKTCPN